MKTYYITHKGEDIKITTELNGDFLVWYPDMSVKLIHMLLDENKNLVWCFRYTAPDEEAEAIGRLIETEI